MRGTLFSDPNQQHIIIFNIFINKQNKTHFSKKRKNENIYRNIYKRQKTRNKSKTQNKNYNNILKNNKQLKTHRKL